MEDLNEDEFDPNSHYLDYITGSEEKAILEAIQKAEDENQPCQIVFYHETIRKLLTRIPVLGDKPYDPNFGDDKVCKCGHHYYRHFDGYEGNRPVGCKYCECHAFQ